MKAEIIAVGTELLLGQVVNTNATFLSEELAALGFEVYYHTVVGDNPQRLTEQLAIGEKRSDLVVLCGGLGPTDDDVTKEVVADFLHQKLILDDKGMDKILRHIANTGKKMTENNRRQALTIEGSQLVENPNGLAVGCLAKSESSYFLLLPGPPNELKPMFFQKVVPLLKEIMPTSERLVSRVLRFFGIGESQLVTELAEIIENQTNPTVAPYAKSSEVTLRLTAKTTTMAEAEAMLDKEEAAIQAIVGEYFYGYGDENTLQNTVVNLLKEKKKTITAAESLTAGLFQSMLGEVSGVSEVFPGGFVTYSGKTKHLLLDVPVAIIENEGVVSESCAKAMAEGALEKLDTDFALSFTGVAGPDELEGKAPGEVWIGLAERNQPTIAKFFKINRNRQYVRYGAVMNGLDMLRKRLLED